MNNKPKEHSEEEEVDFELCSDEDVNQHLAFFICSDAHRVVSVDKICPPYIVSKIFQLAKHWKQNCSVMCHSVNLAGTLIANKAKIYKTTLPLVVNLASKLDLHNKTIGVERIRRFLSSAYNRSYTLPQLFSDEQRLLLSLNFKVGGNYLFEFVGTLLVAVERNDPRLKIRHLLPTANNLVCLYFLRRRNLTDELRSFNRSVAPAILVLAEKLIQGYSDERFVQVLCMTIEEQNTRQVIRNATELETRIFADYENRTPSVPVTIR